MNLIARMSGGRNPVGRIQALTPYYAPTDLAPAVVEVYWRYANEPASAARLIGRYLPGQAVSVPFTPAANQSVILSTISISGAGVRSIPNLRDAPEFELAFPGVLPGNAAADGVTKGIATFTPADFNDDGAGKIAIDYPNGQKASAAQPGFLSATDWSTFNGKLSALPIAKADGVTKGIATFTPADFNDDGAGKIAIDYANGQKASAAQPGFLSAADWTAFNAGAVRPYYFLQPLNLANNGTAQCLAVSGDGVGAKARITVLVGGGVSGDFELLGANHLVRITGGNVAGAFTVTLGTAGKWNIGWDGSKYVIENKSGSSYSPAIHIFPDPLN
jgi:hypothetical protein